jgi:hypothetical protein
LFLYLLLSPLHTLYTYAHTLEGELRG